MTSGTNLGEGLVQVLLIEDNPGDAQLVREMLSDILVVGFIVEKWRRRIRKELEASDLSRGEES